VIAPLLSYIFSRMSLSSFGASLISGRVLNTISFLPVENRSANVYLHLSRNFLKNWELKNSSVVSLSSLLSM
jgi:hypothetical protein